MTDAFSGGCEAEARGASVRVPAAPALRQGGDVFIAVGEALEGATWTSPSGTRPPGNGRMDFSGLGYGPLIGNVIGSRE